MNFHPGDLVRILRRDVADHHRVPGYVMNQVGIVIEVLRSAALPEEAALGYTTPTKVPVYRVRLAHTSLWPSYDGSPHDTLELEVHQHWLMPVDRFDQLSA